MLQAETLQILNGAKSAPKSNLKVQFIPNGDADWVEYTYQDQSKDRIFRPIQQKDIERYPTLWEAYQSARPNKDEGGTPLTGLPSITDDIALQLRLKGVRTAEDLAKLDDAKANSMIANGDGYVKIAKLFFAAATLAKSAASQPAAKASEAKLEAKKAAA